MPGTFRIGNIAGINIDIHMSWIIILALLTVSLATGWFPQLYQGWSTATYWLIAFLSSLLLFVSVLLHELAHSLVARRRGLPVKSITSSMIQTTPLKQKSILLKGFGLLPGWSCFLAQDFHSSLRISSCQC
jgi:Zn-dependent protease